MDTDSFEEAFMQLETLVTALQDGGMPLDRMLQCYQEGMKLVQYCHELLQKAELTIQQLSSDDNGTLSIQPLEL